MGSESTSAALARRAANLRQAGQVIRGESTGLRVSIRDDSNAGALGFDRLFVGLGAVLDNLPSALVAAVPQVREAFARNFESEGASGRGTWTPLAPSTQAQRARLGYGAAHPILRRTGRLAREVLTVPARIDSAPGAGARLTMRPTGDIYQWQALGTSRIPARIMVAVGPSSATSITSVISRFLRSAAGA